MPADTPKIQHISDTALWVACYRAIESERPDALFRDVLAQRLAGERGREIAESILPEARYGLWSVAIRTVVIDELIQRHVSDGVDAVINLGAGLDTRPYRLKLPGSLRWIEIDYADIIEHKERLLADETPGVALERIPLDLALVEERRAVFAKLAASSRRCLILTEGVVPYLTEEEVASLADDLHAEKAFRYWIGEYYAPQTYRLLMARWRKRAMKNAPFRFFPTDWLGLFRSHGWAPKEFRYLFEDAERLRRPMPVPWWVGVLLRWASLCGATQFKKRGGYAVYENTASAQE